jgi:hypothetical protein
MSYEVELEVAGRMVITIAGTIGQVLLPVNVGPSRDGALGFAQAILAGLPDGAISSIRDTEGGERLCAFVKHGDVTYKADAEGSPTHHLAAPLSLAPVTIAEVAVDGSGREVATHEGQAGAIGDRLRGRELVTMTATPMALGRSAPGRVTAGAG